MSVQQAPQEKQKQGKARQNATQSPQGSQQNFAATPAIGVQRAAPVDRNHFLPTTLLSLQRSIGNQAVAHLLNRSDSGAAPRVQAKLHVGPANDPYEREADQIAKQVVSSPALVQPNSAQRKTIDNTIQRDPGNDKPAKPAKPAKPPKPAKPQKTVIPDTVAGMEAMSVPNFPPEQGTPAIYSVTVAVSQGMEGYVRFAKKRMKSTMRNLARASLINMAGVGSLIRNPKSSKQIKEKAARSVLTSRNQPVTDDSVKKVLESANNVGHAWIKFNTHDDEGNILKTYSFGFMYGTAPNHPAQKVAGKVINPDMMFEDEDKNRYLTSEVTAKSYQAGMRTALKLKASPPQYQTTGYNCTKFVREVAKSASATYPSGTGFTIPISNYGEVKLFEKAYNPDLLFDKLGQYKETDDSSPEKEMMEDKSIAVDSQGSLGHREDVMTSDQVYRLIYQKTLVIEATDRKGWEAEGLTAKLLQKLDVDQIQELYEERFEIAKLFHAFGLPIDGLPGAISRGGGYGGYGVYGAPRGRVW